MATTTFDTRAAMAQTTQILGSLVVLVAIFV